MTGLLDAALQLAQSCRPQDGTTAAYLLRWLLKLPGLTGRRLHEYCVSLSSEHSDATEDDDDDDDDDDKDDDRYYWCVHLLLQLLTRQLDVATVNLMQASRFSLSLSDNVSRCFSIGLSRQNYWDAEMKKITGIERCVEKIEF